ncbi:O-antigen polymerase [Vibrio parahaemolyticus]
MGEYLYIAVIVLLFFIFIELYLAKFRTMHLVSPVVINSLCWLIPICFGLTKLDNFNEIESWVVITISFWCIGLNLFFLIASFFTNKSKSKSKCHLNKYAPLLLILSVLLVLKISYDIYIIGNTASNASFFLNLRMVAIGSIKSNQLSVVSVFYPLMYALLLWSFYISLESRVYSKIFLSCLTFSILYVLATMSKFWLLNYVVSLSVIYVSNKGMKSFKQLFFGSLIILFIFFIMTQARLNNAGNASVIEDMIVSYLFAPIVALGDVAITTVDKSQLGEYTFSSFYNIFRFFGLSSSEPISGILPYTFTPEETNIYTALQPFISDFGKGGVILGGMIYVLFYCVTFILSSKYTTVFIIYASMTGSLFLQFLTETLMMNLTGNIKIILCIILIRVCFLKKQKCEKLNV